ncbi:DNA cytosine methyltransferase [Zobellia laminariae]|uniref:DNA cytosine methyltransferase n=1 Tax=Zobellia laminariae TaxID=248906 RepID=UPI0026F46D4C|nr:DNA cytosine methyltransferase [Zobellia laminariae]WKX75545.1 DNA cytosine methyltransferase [Zobellia laminariae]
MSEKKTYIDLFAGCGGLSLGLYNSGLWKGLFAIEKSPDAFETFNHNLIENNNHFDWPNWLPKSNHDINTIIKDYPNELKSLRGKIDMVAGGPPCQGFSTAGKRNENDLRNKLIKSYINFIRQVQPKVIFFENVKGFTQKFDKNKIKGKVYSEYVKKALEYTPKDEKYLGYKVEGRLVDFSEYGVPQKRTRFILVGIRKDIANNTKPTDFFDSIRSEREKFLVNKGIGLTNSLEDAISDLLRINETTSPDTPSFKTGFYNKTKSKYQKLLKGNYSQKFLIVTDLQNTVPLQ